MSAPLIQWYPGHIAKAEKQLSSNLEKVDLVIEVRDARIPISTSHPYLERWIKNKKHLLVINRKDMISPGTIEAWTAWFKAQQKSVFWCNAKTGSGVNQIKTAAIQLGKELNDRRKSRGMRNRPVRALTLGFPNVGKSALINRLVKKKVVSSSRRAGVTRALQWIRLGQTLDLLDAPGVLPPRLEDQKSALKLAICDDIGQAAYDVELVAMEFLKILINQNSLLIEHEKILVRRYGVSFQNTEKDLYKWLNAVSQLHASGDIRRMAQKLLDDFRKLLLGQIPLELP